MSLTLIRRIAGISKSELAKRAGVDLSAISRFEHGRQLRQLRRAEYDTVARIAAAVNLTPDELLTLVEAIPVRFPLYHAMRRRRATPPEPAAAR